MAHQEVATGAPGLHAAADALRAAPHHLCEVPSGGGVALSCEVVHADLQRGIAGGGGWGGG